ncbi:MAG: hypothetical protein HRF50_00730 [Phycisphaerae bacterium]|jgi:hypothetical protein
MERPHDCSAWPSVFSYSSARSGCARRVERFHSYFGFRAGIGGELRSATRAHLRLRINEPLVYGAAATRVLSLALYGVAPDAAELIARLQAGGLRVSTEDNYIAYILRTATVIHSCDELMPKMTVPLPAAALRLVTGALTEQRPFHLGATLTIDSAVPHALDFGDYGLRRLVLEAPGPMSTAIGPSQRVDVHQFGVLSTPGPGTGAPPAGW